LTYTTQGTFTVTWKYDDGRGNVATQNQTVVVNDKAAPVPDVASLPTLTGSCSVTITTKPTATDACVGKITATTTSPLTYTTQGTYTVTWTYSDGRGNVATQNQTVTVSDKTAPVPDVASLPTVSGECSVTLTKPTATDACVGKITATTTNPLTYTTQGTYTVTWTYSDGRGNASTQTQTVIVKDVTAPVMTNVPATVSATITNPPATAVALPTPTASDNCDPSPTVSNNGPATYLPGNTTVTYTAKDVAGNSITATTVVQLRYNFGGFISPTAGGSYALRSKLVVSFQLLDDARRVIPKGAVAKLYYAKVVNGKVGAETLAGTMTFDSKTLRYTYTQNLIPPQFGAGTFQFRVALDDGTSQTVQVTVTP